MQYIPSRLKIGVMFFYIDQEGAIVDLFLMPPMTVNVGTVLYSVQILGHI